MRTQKASKVQNSWRLGLRLDPLRELTEFPRPLAGEGSSLPVTAEGVGKWGSGSPFPPLLSLFPSSLPFPPLPLPPFPCPSLPCPALPLEVVP